MFKDITLGQYYKVDSYIDRLDPRVKLLSSVVFIIVMFISNSFYIFIPSGIFIILMIIFAKLPFSYVLKGIKPIISLIIISAVFNIFLTAGNEIFRWRFISITQEGIYVAIFTIIRLILLVIATSYLTYTTMPSKITEGIEKGLGFLKKIKVPIHEIAMMMSIALRFVPILVEELHKIKKAQMARGADFERGGVIKRAKALIPIMAPLSVSAFRRANFLAMAMESRCYSGSEGRTKMNPLVLKKEDYLGITIIICFAISMILVAIITR